MAGLNPLACDCGDCVRCRRRVYLREWKRRNPEKTRVYQRTYRERNREADREVARRYRENYPEKRAAHNAVTHALLEGRFHREPCEVCGAEPAEAHHDDYSVPLGVRWLCHTHHMEHHRLGRAA